MQEWSSFTLDPEVKFNITLFCYNVIKSELIIIISNLNSHVYFLCFFLFSS